MESATLQNYLHFACCAPNSQVKLGRLLKQFGSLNALLNELQGQTPLKSLDGLQIELSHSGDRCKTCQPAVEKALRWQEPRQRNILCFEDSRYPSLLKEIDDPPPLLYVEGNPELLNHPQIAVIGSRRASNYGLRNAHWLGEQLSKLEICVTSGMATGIDRKAHEGALAKDGKTIAVVGTGVDGCYPRENEGLRNKVVERGAVVSEFPLGSPPHSFHFPQRNRIISGLSLGVVVVEAAVKSGSLITARLAMEQNREVFALPGLITNPMAQGCHRLINDGVTLVQTIEDIAQEIGMGMSTSAATLRPGEPSNNAERLILNVLKTEPATLDYLLASTPVPEPELISGLGALEAKQLIQFSHGRYNYLSRR